ncbi:DUF6979 family protein [Photobacterium sanguinicancri]|uniref:DUF6979 family protein n=1 Tax=Photobacterium sanguinicancri TaxID=875932 RepID=UPI0036F40C45
MQGVPSGSYTWSNFKKQYALETLNLLNKNPNSQNDLKKFWVQSYSSISKIHNSQMDVWCFPRVWLNKEGKLQVVLAHSTAFVLNKFICI